MNFYLGALLREYTQDGWLVYVNYNMRPEVNGDTVITYLNTKTFVRDKEHLWTLK